MGCGVGWCLRKSCLISWICGCSFWYNWVSWGGRNIICLLFRKCNLFMSKSGWEYVLRISVK